MYTRAFMFIIKVSALLFLIAKRITCRHCHHDIVPVYSQECDCTYAIVRVPLSSNRYVEIVTFSVASRQNGTVNYSAITMLTEQTRGKDKSGMRYCPTNPAFRSITRYLFDTMRSQADKSRNRTSGRDE